MLSSDGKGGRKGCNAHVFCVGADERAASFARQLRDILYICNRCRSDRFPNAIFDNADRQNAQINQNRIILPPYGEIFVMLIYVSSKRGEREKETDDDCQLLIDFNIFFSLVSLCLVLHYSRFR